MNKINFLNKTDKKKILNQLEKFGIEKLPYLLIKTGREKIRAYSGSLSKDEIKKLSQLINIEIIGMYFAKEQDNDIRLSLDGCYLVKEQLKNRIIKLNKEETELWIRGQTLEKQGENGLFIIKYNKDIWGMGKRINNKLFNYIPKERRIRK